MFVTECLQICHVGDWADMAQQGQMTPLSAWRLGAGLVRKVDNGTCFAGSFELCLEKRMNFTQVGITV